MAKFLEGRVERYWLSRVKVYDPKVARRVAENHKKIFKKLAAIS